MFGALARRSLAHQTGCGCESGTLSLAKDVKKNTALVGHVFKNLSVQDGRECFQHCGKDCLCLSFNFKPKYREGNCELNDANSIVDPGGLAQAHDIEYYEPRRSYNEVSTTQGPGYFTALRQRLVWLTPERSVPKRLVDYSKVSHQPSQPLKNTSHKQIKRVYDRAITTKRSFYYLFFCIKSIQATVTLLVYLVLGCYFH